MGSISFSAGNQHNIISGKAENRLEWYKSLWANEIQKHDQSEGLLRRIEGFRNPKRYQTRYESVLI